MPCETFRLQQAVVNVAEKFPILVILKQEVD